MLPVLSKEMAVSRSVRLIVEGSGSPRDCIARKLRGYTISTIAEELPKFLIEKPFLLSSSMLGRALI